MTNVDPSTRYVATLYGDDAEPIDSFALTAPDFTAAVNHVSRILADHMEAGLVRSLSIIPETAPEQEGEPAVGF